MKTSTLFAPSLVVVSAMTAGLTTAGPLGVWTVPLALGCLFWVMEARLLQSAALLFLWLFVYFVFGLGWMIWALQSPGSWTFAWSIPLMIGLFAAQASVYVGCYAALTLVAGRVTAKVNAMALRATPLARSGALAAAFLLGDLLRSCLRFGTSWGSLGYSQTDNPLMRGMFALVGTMGVSALIAFLASLSVIAWQSLRTHSPNTQRASLFSPRRPFLPVALIAGTVTWCLAANAGHWTVTSDRAYAIRLIHTSLYEGEKYTPEAQSAAIELLLDLSQRTDVVATLYPELFLVRSAFYYPRAWRTNVMDAVKRSGNHQIVGAPDSLVSVSGLIQGSTNAMIHLSPEGSAQRRPKEALIPFTEQTGSNAIIQWVYSLFSAYPNANFVPAGLGETQPFDLPGFQLAAAICSEISDPLIVNARNLKAGALLNAASESWIHSATLDGMVRQMLQARALESQKPILRAGNGGFSGLVTARGEITKTQDLHTVVLLHPRTGKTPFASAMAWLYSTLNPLPAGAHAE